MRDWKKEKKVSGIAPLQPPTLAPFRAWGIKQELVVPLVAKISNSIFVSNGFAVNQMKKFLPI